MGAGPNLGPIQGKQPPSEMRKCCQCSFALGKAARSSLASRAHLLRASAEQVVLEHVSGALGYCLHVCGCVCRSICCQCSIKRAHRTRHCGAVMTGLTPTKKTGKRQHGAACGTLKFAAPPHTPRRSGCGVGGCD
eukprot:309653-Amphidinium_carterae.1